MVDDICLTMPSIFGGKPRQDYPIITYVPHETYLWNKNSTEVE